MANGNLERIQSAYEAFGRADIGAVLDAFADDIDWSVTEVLPQGGHLHGKQEVAGFFERLPSVWQDLNLDIEDFVASGDRVCVLGRGSGTHDGKQLSYGFVHAWTLQDGDVTRFAEYADPPPELYR